MTFNNWIETHHPEYLEENRILSALAGLAATAGAAHADQPRQSVAPTTPPAIVAKAQPTSPVEPKVQRAVKVGAIDFANAPKKQRINFTVSGKNAAELSEEIKDAVLNLKSQLKEQLAPNVTYEYQVVGKDGKTPIRNGKTNSNILFWNEPTKKGEPLTMNLIIKLTFYLGNEEIEADAALK